MRMNSLAPPAAADALPGAAPLLYIPDPRLPVRASRLAAAKRRLLLMFLRPFRPSGSRRRRMLMPFSIVCTASRPFCCPPGTFQALDARQTRAASQSWPREDRQIKCTLPSSGRAKFLRREHLCSEANKRNGPESTRSRDSHVGRYRSGPARTRPSPFRAPFHGRLRSDCVVSIIFHPLSEHHRRIVSRHAASVKQESRNMLSMYVGFNELDAA